MVIAMIHILVVDIVEYVGQGDCPNSCVGKYVGHANNI